MSVDLELASVDELIAELSTRFPRGLIVVGERPDKVDDKTGEWTLAYRHGLTICIGLAERARARLLQIALTPNTPSTGDVEE